MLVRILVLTTFFLGACSKFAGNLSTELDSSSSGDSGTASLAVSNKASDENLGTIQVPITLSEARKTATVFAWRTMDDTAVAGTHYVSASGKATIPAGQTSTTVGITIIDDPTCTTDVRFKIVLSDLPTGLTANTGTITIVDRQKPTLTASPVSVQEGLIATIPVSLSATCDTDITVTFETGGTALNGVDFLNLTNSFTIPAGSTSKNVPLITFNNSAVDGNKTVQLNLSTSAAELATSTVDVTLVEGDVSLAATTQGTQVSAGYPVSCSVVNGAAYCWGGNFYGEVGDGTTIARNSPTLVSGWSSGVTKVDAGYGHTVCGIRSGAAYCWGTDDDLVLGNGATTGDKSTPYAVTSLTSNVTDISVGGTHACAIQSGNVFCWGRNGSGQLGDASTTARNAPVAVTLPTTATQIDAGENHTCALLSNGRVMCWGSGGSGRLGNGATAASSSPVYVNNIDGTTTIATKVAAGATHSCAVVNGGAQCWGEAGNGELGNASTVDSSSPVDVSTMGASSGVTDISAGGEVYYNRGTSCAVQSGAIKCWGSVNGTNRTTPYSMTGMASGMSKVSVGRWYGCALETGGGIKCWGESPYGNVGNGITALQFVPKDVPNMNKEISSYSTSHSHACVVKQDTSVWCWGANGNGQVGDGTTTDTATPVQVIASGASKVTTGGDNYNAYRHSCALMTDGTAKCWGANNDSQIGKGTTGGNQTTPTTVTVLGGDTITDIVAGKMFTCAIMSSNGSVKCWGNGGSGRLGNNAAASSASAVDVVGLTNVTQLALGPSHACAISGGALYCWGENASGELGIGSTTDSYVPAAVTGMGSGVTWVATNGSDVGSTCAIKSGAAFCWGDGASGRLGLNNTTDYNSPQSITALSSGVTSISMGETMACAVKDGAALCWGSNSMGQLGLNYALGTHYTPEQVTGLTSGISSIDLGRSHACALTTINGVKCWGMNWSGVMGQGNLDYTNSAISILFPQ